jgi:hypothetical protein
MAQSPTQAPLPVASEPPIIIESREELIALLAEASELEHMLMCEYLFATFTLKRSTNEGISQEQLDAITRWDRVISNVASQEMLHLALATNLLSALGAGPHFTRPNFPQYAKYYPPGIQLALRPFGEEALRHFIFLERPEGMEGEDAESFRHVEAQPPLAVTGSEVVPMPQTFATVGHLYRGIEQGFRRLVEKYGERQVFIGPPVAQATQAHFQWPELLAVTDLASAQAAIDAIVEQGEGARGNWQDAHYGTFLSVLREYEECRQREPSLAPARGVLPAHSRPAEDVSQHNTRVIEDHTTARVNDLFNGCYEVTLQILQRYFTRTGETEAEVTTLSDVAVGLMMGAIRPIGILLTTLPIGATYPGLAAGPSFTVYRTSASLPQHEAAWVILHERLLTLAEACVRGRSYPGAAPAARETLVAVEEQLRGFAAALGAHLIPS